MGLSNKQIDFALSSNLNYTKAVHNNHVQDYFAPIFEATDNPKYQRIAVKACHSVGKTFNIARIIESMMSRFNFIKIISTAPTFRQVHDLLWKEIHTAYDNKPAYFRRGKLSQVSWWIDSETFARGFSPAKSVKSEVGQGTDSVFQGYHAKYMLVVVFDEATGVLPQIWEQAEGLLPSGARTLFIAIGNPTSRNCNFFKCFNDRAWKTFSISCFDSPNLKAAGIQSIDDILKEVEHINGLNDEDALERLFSYPCPVSYLINTRWVIEKAIEWGVTHPLFLGKVLGDFPGADTDSLFSEEDVKAAQERNIDIEKETTAFVGLDVARFGEDKSVLTSLIGPRQCGLKSMANYDTNEVVGETIKFIERLKEKHPKIKRIRLAVDGGFGHGVIDNLIEDKKDSSNKRVFRALQTVEILEINFGGQNWVTFHYGWVDEFSYKKKKQDRKVQEDRENFSNFKSKMFDLLSRDVKRELQLLPDPVYIKQLPKVIRRPDSKGRLAIESKEDFKKRTGETSPDETDSLGLANFARYFAIKQISVTEAMKNRKNR